MTNDTPLKRSLSLPLITFYGVGTILGAGIYVLIGEVSRLSGVLAPFAFLLAALTATFTAFSFAELSSRYPKSAGEVVYIKAGLKKDWLSKMVGYMVVLTGTVSAATIAHGFVGYFQIFMPTSPTYIIITLVLFLGALAILGIVESVGVATLITLFEVGGLLFVILAVGNEIQFSEVSFINFIPHSLDAKTFSGLMAGSFIAFYAFIGFEDMVNVAEEVISPKKNLPKAIILALVISSLLYLIVSVIFVVSLSPNELGESKAPLAVLIKNKTSFSPTIISLISLLAVVNGALIQIIMASRVLYGMGKSNLGFKYFSFVSPKTRTPIRATVLITFLVLALALWLPLLKLAQATSFITLSIFLLVNISLIMIKVRGEPADEAKVYPIWLPILGVLTCAAMIIAQFI